MNWGELLGFTQSECCGACVHVINLACLTILSSTDIRNMIFISYSADASQAPNFLSMNFFRFRICCLGFVCL